MTELSCPRCGDRELRRGKVEFFDPDVTRGVTRVTTIERQSTSRRLMPTAKVFLNPRGAQEGLTIAFDCSTCGDGLTLTLVDEWGASFEWSFTSEAEDALAALRAAGDEAALDRHWPGDEIAQGGEPRDEVFRGMWRGEGDC